MTRNAFASLTVNDLLTLWERAQRGTLSTADRQHLVDEWLPDLLDIAIDWKLRSEELDRMFYPPEKGQ